MVNENTKEYIQKYNIIVRKFKQNNININDFEQIFNLLDNFTTNLIKNYLKFEKFNYCIEILYNYGKSNYF